MAKWVRDFFRGAREQPPLTLGHVLGSFVHGDHIFSFIDSERALDSGSSTEGFTIQQEDTSQTSILSSLESRIESMTSRTCLVCVHRRP